MKVRLIAVSQPRFDLIRTAEQLIVYCARVSNPSNQDNHETGERLLRYCIRHGHWSVFETASMTVEITTSRAIAAQLLRHRSFTFQEFSQRYAEVSAIEKPELRKQAVQNRQSSVELVDDPIIAGKVRGIIGQAQHVYTQLIEAGVARECARMILPLCTQTTLYMTGSVRSWIHYLEQRLSEHTQLEHRQVAQEIERIFATEFPTIHNAIKTNNEQK